jgi:hypothetical protein
VCPRDRAARAAIPSESRSAAPKELEMRSIRMLFAVAAVSAALVATAAEPTAPAAPKQGSEATAKCDHGVKKSVCTRCNPKLAPVFKAKGDWCAEHDRPESQCVLCNRALAKEGVK